MSIRRIRRTAEQRRQDLLKKGLMIPLPWLTYGFLSTLFSPFVGGVGMMMVIGAFAKKYDQRLIGFQKIFIAFAVCKILLYFYPSESPLLANTAWLSGVLLGSFTGLGLLFRQPFTVALVEEFFPQEMIESEHFWRINQSITLVWGMNFWLSALISTLPIRGLFQTILTLLTMAGASWFTKFFPPWYRYHVVIPLFRSGKEPYQPFVEL